MALRAALAGTLAVWLVLRGGPLLIETLVPYLGAAVQWMDARYTYTFELTYRTPQGGSGSELALLGRAAVARLFFIPIEEGIIPMRPGTLLTSSTAIGVLLQPAVMLIALLTGWPARSRREMMARALAGTAVLALWLLAGLPLTLWIYFRDIPLHAFAPHETTLATPIGKFLLNGGSVALGAALGCAAVRTSVRLAEAGRAGPGPAVLPQSPG